MAYVALAQADEDAAALSSYSPGERSPGAQQSEECALRPPPVRDTNNASSRLFMGSTPFFDLGHNTAIRSVLTTSATLDAALEKEDSSSASTPDSPLLPSIAPGHTPLGRSLNFPKQRRSPSRSFSTSQSSDKSLSTARSTGPDPVLRTASGRSSALRHPTPDLHSRKGSFISSVEHLERTAEKLSMTSSIEDAIRHMHDEQKRSDSRRSSLLASPIDVPQRQYSNRSSIVDVNSAARSPGYSPRGINMATTSQSVSGYPRNRPESSGVRFRTHAEPEFELGSIGFVANHHVSAGPAIVSCSASIAENDESPTMTMTRPQIDAPFSPVERYLSEGVEDGEERPSTAASTTTYEQAQKVFSDFDGQHVEDDEERPTTANTYEQAQRVFTDFDGEHFAPRSREVSDSTPVPTGQITTSASRLVIPRPQSYADPSTGQQMVYYPAPVPKMLNLPQKLSKLPSTMARDKRRAQVMSSIPPSARQSAIWLPDVLEDESDQVNKDDPIQQQEYVPQHQRQTMGGRRTTRDIDHLPAQLRASTFFEHPSIGQTVEVKGESAVKTLESILNASAYAPVNAFTDHAFAGRLGAEVYGPSHKRASKSKSQIFEPEIASEARASTFNIFQFRRSSSNNQLASDPAEKRRSTMSRLTEPGKFDASSRPESENGKGAFEKQADSVENEDGEAHDSESEPEFEPEEEDDYEEDIYHGAPTTLLAELQLRKQHQKQRTRPVAAIYPNGMHSTLLELDAVAQVEKKTRKLQRINLAWEDPTVQDFERANEANEDVPLALLYPQKTPAYQSGDRPMGLMEKRDLEDNEPLSKRRERLIGKPAVIARASTMFNIPSGPPEEEGETLAQRSRRLKEQAGTLTGLPAPKRVSDDFTLEMLNQLGGEDMDSRNDKGKGKEAISPPEEEEETLGQRRKRLQAEREARTEELAADGDGVTAQPPPLKTRHSMADILTALPAAGALRSTSHNLAKPEKPAAGLLGLHERKTNERSAQLQTMNTNAQLQGTKLGFSTSMNNFAPHNQFNMPPGQYHQQQMMMPFVNPYMMGMGHAMQQNPMAASMLQLGQNGQPLNQGQLDMVERWRQSVMQ